MSTGVEISPKGTAKVMTRASASSGEYAMSSFETSVICPFDVGSPLRIIMRSFFSFASNGIEAVRSHSAQAWYTSARLF